MSYQSTSELTEKKRLGVFYTPGQVSRILCDWAIRSPSEMILEPSFGGCGFLEASVERLKVLGVQHPNKHIFGCDIDQAAFQYLSDKIGPSTIDGRFIFSDFLNLNRDSFSLDSFDVVIGNPPYVSHHNMSLEQKVSAACAIKDAGFNLSAKASLWAYFLLHSLQFLKDGGRMAWVLPGSFLYANYADEIRRVFSGLFVRTLMISLGERIFISEGTDESTVLLFCDGYSQGAAAADLELLFAENTADLENDLQRWQVGHGSVTSFNGKYGLSILQEELVEVFSSIDSLPDVVKLGDLAKVSIGIVTGDNKYFILSEEDAKKHNLARSSFRWIFSKFSMSQGLKINDDDMLSSIKSNARCLLIDTSKTRLSNKSLQNYLDLYPEFKKSKNKTFKKRSLWHQPIYGEIPDAFFPYMHHTGPRIILNESNVTSTNTIHRIFFEDMPRYKKRLASISMLTTFSQVSAEIEGRCYGSGVLKHEPSEAKKISLIMPQNVAVKEINYLYGILDNCIRNSKNEEARELADRFIFDKVFDSNYDETLQALNVILLQLRSLRHKTQRVQNVNHTRTKKIIVNGS